MSLAVESQPQPAGRDLRAGYTGQPVMVAGGLGFLGSNLTLRLLELGAAVHVVDSLVPECGGNFFNLRAALESNAAEEGRLRVSVRDLRETDFMAEAVAGPRLIFNLAGQVDHLGSMADPLADLEINCRAQLSLLEACRRSNPKVKVVFASSRQLYGRPMRLPVDEEHPVEPVDINGIHKRAAERYHFIYGVYGLRACALRLTNTYGPRQLVRSSRQGFLGWFIRQAMEGEEILLYGDGNQLRDPIYVDDVVEAFLRAGLCSAADGKVLNLGAAPISLRHIAETLIAITGRGALRSIPFPEDRKPIDIGSYYGDYSQVQKLFGWRPKISLEEGLRHTVEYYGQYKEEYW